MKKLIILFAVFFLIPHVFAISTDMKPVYEPGETMIVELFGNILEPIQKENVELKRRNVQVPWEYDVKKIGDIYFIYGVLPKAENNYTLHINEISTTVQGIVQEVDFEQNFTTLGNLVAYSIKPGFAVTSDDLEFTIFLNRDFNELIPLDFPQQGNFILYPGENKLQISTSGAETGFRKIQVGIYSVPIFIIAGEENSQALPKLRFYPRNIESVILINEEIVYPFSIINERGTAVRELFLEYNPEVFTLQPAFPDFIGPEETLNFNISLKNRNQPVDEVLILKTGDLSMELPVSVVYTENPGEVSTPYLGEEYSESQGYFCSELGGQACTADEVCSTSVVSSLDVPNCCLGSCTPGGEDSGTYSWLGWLIGAILIIVLVFIGARYLKKRKEKTDPFSRETKKEKKDHIKPPAPSSRVKY